MLLGRLCESNQHAAGDEPYLRPDTQPTAEESLCRATTRTLALSRAVALVDRSGRDTGAVTSSASSSVFAGFRFPREVIAVAVR